MLRCPRFLLLLARLVTRSAVIGTSLLATAAAAATLGAHSAALGPHRNGSRPAHAHASRAPDTVVTGRGDSAGYHLFEASPSTHWRWRALASFDPHGIDERSWVGYQCVTGDGRFAAVVLAPADAANSPAERQRGGFAYSVNLRDGRVRELGAGVALMYFDPGCGAGDAVTLSTYLGDEEQRTAVDVVSASSGRTSFASSYRGEITSSVETTAGLLGTRDATLVRLSAHHVTPISRFDGQPFAIRSSARGADFLVATHSGKALVESLTGTETRYDGWGGLYSTNLFLGADGENVLAGARAMARGSFRRMRAPDAYLEAASRFGDALVGTPVSSAKAADRSGAEVARPNAVSITDAAGRRMSLEEPVGIGHTITAAARPPHVPRAFAASAKEKPTCAVPRLETKIQVLQPNDSEVDWAVEQAARGYLKGSVLTRPKDFDNLKLPAYSPSTDLPPPSLDGYPGTPVPRSLIEAILAQESNYDQASFHALPGVAGDPLVADYYGAQGSINTIDYALADCGYGIGQVTTGMTAEATSPYSSSTKTKIAVDYAENIAAAIEILGNTWNTLAENGVTLNGGNPNYLENWYFAAWAYNTGFHANTGSGPWGLGWTNNPQNSSYPPNRTPFLRDSYADAAHPGNWPYQERVIGWMETPLLNYKGEQSYAGAFTEAGQPLNIPAFSTFCTASNNCSPSYKNKSNESLDYCELESRECWWHLPVTYADCPSNCATSSFTTSSSATEPADDQTYLPDCESSLPSGTVIVDDEPTDYNLRGCVDDNWGSEGKFKVTYGENAAKVPVGEIDWHQLGTGFGGHLWFTHNRLAGETELIDTGTWTPGNLEPGLYAIQAHIPVNGATSPEATYTIYPGNGSSSSVTIDQHVGGNQWIPLGDFQITNGKTAKVVLTNVTKGVPGTTDIAFDAVAFTLIAHTPNSEQELAERFEPVLKFDTNEKWRPLNLTAFFAETESNGTPVQHKCIPYSSPDASTILGEEPPFKTTPGDYATWVTNGEVKVYKDIARCVPVSTIEEATSWRSPDAYIDIGELGVGEVESYHSVHSVCLHNGLLDCNGNEVPHDPYSAQYYYITTSSGYQFIQYWQFYRYNSFSNTISEFGSHHEGDWEAVAIAPSQNGQYAEFASFSQHGAWYSYTRTAMECADQPQDTCGSNSEPRGKRVVVYVADGDHANYATPCKEEIPFECERGDGEVPKERLSS